MNSLIASFDTDVRQMTEISQQKNNPDWNIKAGMGNLWPALYIFFSVIDQNIFEMTKKNKSFRSE